MTDARKTAEALDLLVHCDHCRGDRCHGRCPAMLKVEAVIRAAQHEARLAAIAECARVCKERGDHLHRERRYDESEEAHSLADMIRALATGEGGG